MKEQEVQLTIADYNAEGEVIDRESVVNTDETITAEPIDLKALTKEELVDMVSNLHRTIETINNSLETVKAQAKTNIDNLNEFYKGQLNIKNNLIAYYERKFKLLNDIITIEEGVSKC